MRRIFVLSGAIALSLWSCSSDDAPGEVSGAAGSLNGFSGAATAGGAGEGPQGGAESGAAAGSAGKGTSVAGNAGAGAGGANAGGTGGTGGVEAIGGDGGTGGANTEPAPGSCTDGNVNRAIVKPIAGQLVITEVLANPANVVGGIDAEREWFEVTNTGAAAFDLNDLTLKNATSESLITSPQCISVAPGAFAVLARTLDSTKNGGLPAPRAAFTFTLVDNGANAAVSVSDGATVLDAVTWSSATSGVSLALDPDQTTAAGNDVPNAWCNATADYGDLSNKGSPGAANAQCP